MLSLPTMGALALALLWGNTALVGWSGAREVAALLARARRAAAPGALLARAAVVSLGHACAIGMIAAASVLSLHDPIVSLESRFGALSALVGFLLLLPLGTALRDVARGGGPAPVRSGATS